MSYRVQVRETHASFEVEPDESILSGALRANVSLPHNCQLGGCGTCRIKLIEGTVTYSEFPFALTPEEAIAGYALACQAAPASDLMISPAGVASICTEPARYTAIINDIRPIGRDVIHLTLEVPGAGSMVYRPGQYMNVHIAAGSTRSFSMASKSRAGRVDFHVRKIPGGSFTEERLARMQAGDALEVELPLGSFHFHAEDFRPLLLVATGTGLAPLKAILELLFDDPDCPPVSLYWGTRTLADLYLHDEIPSWGTRLYQFRYVPVLSRADAQWRGRRGHVQDAITDDLDDLSEYSIYLCGSPAMISDAKQAFIARGASIAHIYTEGFAFQLAQTGRQ